jgi:hypothetical protein
MTLFYLTASETLLPCLLSLPTSVADPITASDVEALAQALVQNLSLATGDTGKRRIDLVTQWSSVHTNTKPTARFRTVV